MTTRQDKPLNGSGAAGIPSHRTDDVPTPSETLSAERGVFSLSESLISESSKAHSPEVVAQVHELISRLFPDGDVQRLISENLRLRQEVDSFRTERAKFVSGLELLGKNQAYSEVDLDGTILFVNAKVSELFGYSDAELVGSKISMFRSGVHEDAVLEGFWNTVLSGEPWEGDLCERKKDGSLVWLRVIARPVMESGKPILCQIVGHDITELEELRRLNVELVNAKIHPASGLPNRAKLMEDLESPEFVTAGIVHVNHLGEVNNAFGVKAGDAALIQVGSALQRYFAEKGVRSYRLEGAEFAVLCKTPLSEDCIGGVAEFLSGIIFEQDGISVPLTFSVGFASDGSTGHELLTRANIALDKSKKSDNSVSVFQDDMLKTSLLQKGFEMVSLVRLALDNDLFVPFYQEIHDNFGKTPDLKKVECLVRMIDPSNAGTYISPGLFLTAAKKDGRLRAITRVMTEKTFSELANENVVFGINLTADDLADPDFFFLVRESLAKYRIDPSRVIFEILEGIDTKRGEMAIISAKSLKSLGCKIAIDDFGSHNANLTRIVDFAADFIKIDMKYVRGIDKNKKNESLLRHIIKFAHENGILVVAEGVETQEEQNVLVSLGADFSQGYLFSKPSRKW